MISVIEDPFAQETCDSWANSLRSIMDDFIGSTDNGKGKSKRFLKDGGKMQSENLLENKQPLQAGWSEYLYFCII